MIGIFDSGVGGLSVFREIRKVLPEQSYIYYSDNAHCPYGEKSREYIIDRTRAITQMLIEKGCEIIVVACNTATAAAISTLREEFPIKFIGMEPAIKPAAQATKTGVVGVLATAGTLKATKYIDTRAKWAQNVKIVEHIGQGFVELVENGSVCGPAAETTVSASLKPLLDAGADTIVLGCTHYPFLIDTIKKVASETYPDREITVIDPAPAVARHLVEVMAEEDIEPVSKEGYQIELLASGTQENLHRTFDTLL
ncbi:MAG: glutamate racemase [Bacteroidales bacterium]|nr:glutamate racemase [Bacteroidales bacterium]MBR5861956.1 glutamate racemase [Bacteroidales bacterium]